tara:strand:- start:139 stop:468 length:330 start_codon:yes stop_codon:yes gene_type:complete
MKGLGGMGDMMGLMKQAQKMKKDMKKLKKEISKTNITVSDNNNILTVVMNGDHIIQKVAINEDVTNLDHKELQNLIKDTLNKVTKEVDAMSADKMSVLTKQGMPSDLPF